jgi:hypothetical protein
MVRVLPIHFGVVFGCKGGGGKKHLLGPEKFFSAAGIPNRAIGQPKRELDDQPMDLGVCYLQTKPYYV